MMNDRFDHFKTGIRHDCLYQGWKIHVMGVTLPRIRGFSYVTWQVFAILPINAMVAK